MIAKHPAEVSGHVCPCGERHKWPAYVYAHWRDLLTHSCNKCNQKTSLLSGVCSPKRETF